MSVQILSARDFSTLENPGVHSQQLIWPRNVPEATVTMTRVTMDPGATTGRHSHAKSEQNWVVEKGTATLLLAHHKTMELRAGDVIHTPAGEVHGLTNSGKEPFVYLTATTPPINLTKDYQSLVEPE